MAFVVLHGGEYRGEHMEVPGDRLTIGRSADCDLILQSKDVSSRHAQLILRHKIWWLQDLGSTNGTLFKKKKIIHQVLADGDEFAIATYRFVFAENTERF